jgi:hypothetical protein
VAPKTVTFMLLSPRGVGGARADGGSARAVGVSG